MHHTRKTEDKTLVTINSHQSPEGPVAWYGAHPCSEQRWNISDGLFTGRATIFHGVDEHPGWAHTVNYQNRINIYQLQIDKAPQISIFPTGSG